MNQSPESKERILLVRLSAIGDIVHTMPAAVAIKRAKPDWTLHWAVQENLAGVLSGFEYADRVIPVPRRPSLSDLLQLRRTFHSEGYTTALDMQGLFKSARLVFLSAAKRRLGYFFQRECSRFFSKPVIPPAERKHVVEHYLSVAEALIGATDVVAFGLKPTAVAIKAVAPLLEAARATGRRLLVVNIGAGQPEKRWPLDKFIEAMHLARETGWEPVLIGGSTEVPDCDRAAAALNPPATNLAGRTNLEELVAVIALADAHMGGDTGSTHIAVALGKPVACMMGPTHPDRSGPFRRPDQVAYKGVDRLHEISAEEVIALLPR